MSRTLRTTVAALLTMALASGVLAQEPAAGKTLSLSLDAAVHKALADNPRAIQASAGEEIAGARLDQARSTWFPRVEASQTWSRGDHPVFVFGSLLEQGRFGPENFDPAFLNDPPTMEHYRLALDLKMPIFDQLRRISTVSQAKLGFESARSGFVAAQQQIRLETLRAYFGVLVARRALDVALDAVAAAESDVSSIRDRFETGLIVESDLLAAEVQLAEFRQQEISARGNLAIAIAQLQAMLDLPTGIPIELTSELHEPSQTLLPLEEQLRLGLENHPGIASARLSERMAGLEVRKARGRYLPRLDGFATFAENGDSLGEDLSDDKLVGLRLSLSIFEPGREGALAEAHAGKRAASAGLKALENQITVEIIRAWEGLQAARQRLEVAERSLSQARETVRIVRDRYEEGLVTITEQLRAQTAVTRAELNHLASIHDTTIGYARLLWATGRLDDVEPFLD